MELLDIEYGFIEQLDSDTVEKIVCDYQSGFCTIYYRNKSVQKLNVGCTSYNRQYGMPVSVDGHILFTSMWEKGLYAYDITSGNILWELREKKITAIFVYDTYIIAHKFGTSIIKLDVYTGKLLGAIKSTTIEYQYDLGSPYDFVVSIGGKPSVIDTRTMTIVKQYGKKIVNPSNYLSVLIQNATLSDNKLIIYGIEDCSQDNPTGGTPIRFERTIDSNFITEQ